MSLVNFNGIFSSVNSNKAQGVKSQSAAKPVFTTPAPSVETAGSIASAAPASCSFSAVC